MVGTEVEEGAGLAMVGRGGAEGDEDAMLSCGHARGLPHQDEHEVAISRVKAMLLNYVASAL